MVRDKRIRRDVRKGWLGMGTALCVYLLVLLTYSPCFSRVDTELLAGDDFFNPIHLAPAERDWLAHHKRILVGGPRNSPPFHFYDKNGKQVGITADYLNLIARKMDVQVEVFSDLLWPEVLRKIRQKELDLIPCIAKSSEREPFIRFSQPVLSFPLVIITRKDAPFVGGINDLLGKRIAVIKKVVTSDWLAKEHLSFDQYLVDTPLQALEAVSTGQADAHIGNLAALTYLIEKHGFSNLKIAAPTRYGNYNLYFGVRDDYPELISLLNKIFDAMKPEVHARIKNKWLTIRYEFGVRAIDIIKWVILILGVSAVLIGWFLWTNKKLEQEIQERILTANALRESEAELTRNVKRWKSLLTLSQMDSLDTRIQHRYVLKTAVKLTESQIGYLYQAESSMDPQVHFWTYMATSDQQCQLENQGHQADELAGIWADALRRRAPVIHNDYRNSSAKKGCPAGHFKITRHMGVPVFDDDQLVAVVGVGNKKKEYTDEEANQLSLLMQSMWRTLKEKKTTEKLRISEERYRKIFDNIMDSIFIADETGRITDVNPQGCVTYGYTKDELIGRHASELVIPEYHHEFKKFIHTTTQGSLYKGQTIDRRKDGQLIHTEIRGTAVQYMGQKRLMAIVRDMTHQKNAESEKSKLEIQIRRAQKLEAIGTLAGGIAHDFNNILSPIIGYTEIMMNLPEQDGHASGYVQNIFKAAQRAKELVQQILTFSRDQESEFKPFKFEPILKESVKFLRSSIPRSIQIDLKCFEINSMILGDPTQVQQVIMNLGTNAYHAMQDQGGVLGIVLQKENIADSDSAMQAEAHHPGNYLVLIMSDTGKGMDAYTLERIFDPYFTTKEQGKGTGLGLAIAHTIIKAHGGWIGVKSQPGQGTEFRIYLPLFEHYLKEENDHSIKTLPKGKEKILLVDDEISILQLQKQFLQQLGYSVTALNQSLKALEVFQENPDQFNLMMTDLEMPGMTGDVLVKKILAIRPNLPVILTTGFSERIDEESARRLGVRAFLLKPVFSGDLAHTLREVL